MGWGSSLKIGAIAVCATLLLAACQTVYKPEGIGGGYEDLRLSADTFEIRARGNGYTSPERTRNIVLLRAADLAIQNGFTHFAILNGSMNASQSTFVSPGTSTTNAQASIYGNTVYGRAQTTYMPPTQETITNFHGSAIVKMFKDPAPGAFDAELIYDQLYPKLSRGG